MSVDDKIADGGEDTLSGRLLASARRPMGRAEVLLAKMQWAGRKASICLIIWTCHDWEHWEHGREKKTYLVLQFQILKDSLDNHVGFGQMLRCQRTQGDHHLLPAGSVVSKRDQM